ncbi:NAD(P)-dependent glycerol-3-phosphate dehydrogenase [Ectothiorhodospiraceae bacterium 2226]|nr:NAD(P)-dependent glycerol-3-phosphate dehydrogenase [Ectothiorhodospiraceae bacterium 2226]
MAGQGYTPGSVSVLGAGSWGTALAVLLARGGRPAVLWGRDPAQIAQMRETRVNARYLPQTTLPDTLVLEDDLGAAVRRSRDVLVAVPSGAFRGTLEAIAPHCAPDQRLLWATKGLEAGSGKLLHQVAEEVLGRQVPLGVVSGPTFAAEVARGYPTAVTLAVPDEAFCSEMVERFHDDHFRAYRTHDIVGVEVGGAVKNVLAIATGISDGLGYGANARAALITRGLAEATRLAAQLGGETETLMGLGGLGDLVLTCTDDQSRNRRLGLALGRGRSMAEAVAEIKQVVEGIETARVVWEVAQREHVEMPITEQVYRVLHEGVAPREAVQALLERDPRHEHPLAEG